MNVHVLYVLELKTSEKISARLSVCMYVCLSVRRYVCTLGRLQNLSGCTITFEVISTSKLNLVGVFNV